MMAQLGLVTRQENAEARNPFDAEMLEVVAGQLGTLLLSENYFR